MVLARMRWSDLLCLHWDVHPGRLASWVPSWLTLDVRSGRAFVGAIALQARGPVPPLPWALVRRVPAYAQLNVRTYVHGPAGPGILLRRTSVGSVLAAAGAQLVGMPYEPERAHVDREDGWLEVESAPVSCEGTVPSGKYRRPDGVEGWLLERYVVYGELPGGVPYHVRVRHKPWRVRRAALASCEVRIPEVDGARPGSVLAARSLDVDLITFAPELSRVRTAHEPQPARS